LQASKLAECGFHRCHYLVIVAVDASQAPSVNSWQPELTVTQTERILATLQDVRLDERVGVMLFILTQHTSDDPGIPLSGTRRVVGVRDALPQVQPHHLTAGVRGYFADNPTDT
jgi:hypothetical protein